MRKNDQQPLDKGIEKRGWGKTISAISRKFVFPNTSPATIILSMKSGPQWVSTEGIDLLSALALLCGRVVAIGTILRPSTPVPLPCNVAPRQKPPLAFCPIPFAANQRGMRPERGDQYAQTHSAIGLSCLIARAAFPLILCFWGLANPNSISHGKFSRQCPAQCGHDFRPKSTHLHLCTLI